MPIFKVRVIVEASRECVFLAHLPSRDHLNKSAEDRDDAIDFAESCGSWDEDDGSYGYIVTEPTKHDLETMDIGEDAHFGCEPELPPEKPFIDPNQLSIFHD